MLQNGCGEGREGGHEIVFLSDPRSFLMPWIFVWGCLFPVVICGICLSNAKVTMVLPLHLTDINWLFLSFLKFFLPFFFSSLFHFASSNREVQDVFREIQQEIRTAIFSRLASKVVWNKWSGVSLKSISIRVQCVDLPPTTSNSASACALLRVDADPALTGWELSADGRHQFVHSVRVCRVSILGTL